MTRDGDARTTYRLDYETGSQWVYLDKHPDEKPRVGVSLSGGGIRSAAFSMGAMQRLIAQDLFGRIEHLAAVSGGTYIAGAMSITRSTSKDGSLDGFPWTHGSPEERKLRLETTYLANGARDSLWLVSNFLYGLILNLSTLAIPVYVLGFVLGFVFSPFVVYSNQEYNIESETKSALAISVIISFFSSVFIVGFRRYRDKARQHVEENIVDVLQNMNAFAWYSILAIAALFAMPYALTQIHWLSNTAQGVIRQIAPEALGIAVIARVIVAVLVMITLATVGGAALWLGRFFRRPRLFAPIAMIAGPGLLLTPFILAVDSSLSKNMNALEIFPYVASGLAGVALCSVLAHNRRYSLHLFYRERLQRAFGIRRSQSDDGSITAQSISYNEEILLSEIGNANQKEKEQRKFPNVIYCASVAASRTEAPYRHNASSYTFESNWCGGPLIGYTATGALEKERGAGGTELTIPSIMAISGAAVSPMMGRFSEPPLRFLMAMLNLRLGVWLPHPRRIGPDMLGAFDKMIDSFKDKIISKTDSTGSVTAPTLGQRLVTYLYHGWIEPGPLYVLYEALGRAKARGKYVYVSDGGHWENLGLVELLRRRCSHIVIVDSSASNQKLDEELARAARLANSELGVEITVDLSNLDTPGEDELPASPCARGKILYPDGKEGTFVYIRSMLWKDAPFELKSFKDYDALFPHHPTSNQFFSGEQFDAYRQLGWAAAEYVKELQIPDPSDTRHEGAEIMA